MRHEVVYESAYPSFWDADNHAQSIIVCANERNEKIKVDLVSNKGSTDTLYSAACYSDAEIMLAKFRTDMRRVSDIEQVAVHTMENMIFLIRAGKGPEVSKIITNALGEL